MGKVAKSEGKKPIGGTVERWMDDKKMYLKDIGYEGIITALLISSIIYCPTLGAKCIL
jgi:hypothetical protein